MYILSLLSFFWHMHPSIRIISKQTYLIHRLDLNQYYHSWSEWDVGVMKLKGYFTLARSPELEPRHQVYFCIITRTPFFRRGTYLSS